LRPCAAEGAPERTWGAGLDIVITSNGDDVTNRFHCAPTSKRFPSSLWASRQHTDRLIEASAGFAITPATPVVEGHSLLIRRSDLAYTDNPLTQSATSGARLFAPCFERTDAQRAADREALATALPNPAPARQAVLSALAVALDAPTLRPHLSDRVGPATPDAWLYAPHLASVSTP
jgi:hypothetical protein